MMEAVFKKSIVISLLGHFVAFGIFNVSFSRHLAMVDYGNLTFQGSVLNSFDFRLPGRINPVNQGRKEGLKALSTKLDVEDLRSQAKSEGGLAGWKYLKPAALVPFFLEKHTLVQKTTPVAKGREKTTVMFYPQLPHYFSLYFRDRQRVYIELMFKVTPGSQASPISLKRKISSGNLEADLLCMRYINHYLFVQQKMLASGNWQTVKIELSAKND